MSINRRYQLSTELGPYSLSFPYPLKIPDHFALTAAVFCQALEAFVVAHEFAHICAGHVSGLSKRSSRLLSGKNVEELPRDADQEFEADSIAWTWIQRATTRLPFLDALKPEFRENCAALSLCGFTMRIQKRKRLCLTRYASCSC